MTLLLAVLVLAMVVGLFRCTTSGLALFIRRPRAGLIVFVLFSLPWVVGKVAGCVRELRSEGAPREVCGE